MRVALDRSAVFVQLLSDDPGPNVNGTDHRLVAAQHDLAARMSKPALIWRSRTLDPGKVNDVAHRELLENPNVMALEIQELKRTIVERVKAVLTPEPAPKDRGQNGSFIIVDVDDEELTKVIDEGLQQRAFGYAIAPRGGDPNGARPRWMQP